MRGFQIPVAGFVQAAGLQRVLAGEGGGEQAVIGHALGAIFGRRLSLRRRQGGRREQWKQQQKQETRGSCGHVMGQRRAGAVK
jgi:hypothetical protein